MILTIDTGGTKTLFASFSSDGIIKKQIKLPTPKDQGDYIQLLIKTIDNEFNFEPIEAISIALPGIFVGNIAVWCNNLGWKDFDIIKHLSDYTGDIPLFVQNDANLAGLAEARMINPLPKSSLYVTISTGIGTGYISNGKIDSELSSSEGGHMLLEFEGKLQEWEKFASGSSIVTKFGKYARDINDDQTWNQIIERISKGFFAIIPLTQPEIIIIGGSIGTHFEKYGHKLQMLIKSQLPSHIPCPQFIQAAHPEEAVVYGCYYYAIDCMSS